MKSTTFTMVCLLAGFSAHAQAAEPVHQSLDGDWQFTYTEPSASEIPEIPSDSAFDSLIKVPGHWDDQLDRFKNAAWRPRAMFRSSLGPVQYLAGIGWHRKLIEAPQDWNGRVATLTIGSAVGTVHVWLNRQYLGANDLGVYTPWELDVTRDLSPGKSNELIIAIDNAKPILWGGWALDGNAGMASGLSRSVSLDLSAGPARIADVYVKPGTDLKEVVWQVDLHSATKEQEIPPSKIGWTVSDTKGRELARGEAEVPAFSNSGSVTWKTRIDAIKPWSDRDPNLYVTKLRWLAADGSLRDAHEQRFGLRHWSYEGRKLFLNGDPMYLRLEIGAYYFPLDGAVSMSKDYWLAHMRRLKELGLNGINFAAQVCPIEMLEAADELGVILQCGDDAASRPAAKARYQEVWDSIVRHTRQYPSLAIYGFGGELQYYEGVIEQYKAQRELIKSLHPESLVMPQQALHGIDYGIADPQAPGVKTKPFLHHAERLARYTEACDLFGHYSGGAFSHQYFSKPWREMEAKFTVYKKPLVAHELFLSASYLNRDNAAKYTGRIPPYLYTRLERDLREADLLEKWPIYFDHTSRLQHICRKYCVEKARKCDGLAGFEILGMMDTHFMTPEYAVGIVDEFLQMKPGDTAAGVRRYCDESVLLLDFDNGQAINRCYWEQEPFQADVMASLYGARALENGKLTWSLKDGEEIVLSGTNAIARIANGNVSKIAPLKFAWPEAHSTRRLKLVVELKGDGYSLANDWDFWVFPKAAPPTTVADADAKCVKLLKGRYPEIKAAIGESMQPLRVVSQLQAADVEHLTAGGDVVLLGTTPFTPYNAWPSFYPAKGYRPFSNGGTIIAKHPIFAGHPNEGWNDWLFYPLMDGANSVLFDNAIDMKFDPVMEIISSAGHVRRQALLFENRVGKGRLLVTTLAFNMRNASCVTMMDSLLRYVQGEEFRPKQSIDPAELSGALSRTGLTENILIDPGFEKSGYWVTEGGNISIDSKTPREGRKALKLVIGEKEFSGNRHFTSSVSARNLGFQKNPRRLQLSGWVKADLRDPAASVQLRAEARLKDAYIRSETYAIETPDTGGEWRYIEKSFDIEGVITSINLYVQLTGAPGVALVDDIYLGPARTASASVTSPSDQRVAADDHRAWKKEAIVRKFPMPVWYRVDQEEWREGTTVTIDREGEHMLSVKKAKDDPDAQEEKVYIDLTPPTVTLNIAPQLEQEAGIFTTTADTVFSFEATDRLSGVKEFEVTTDGKTYRPYTKPFQLSPGKYRVQCRVTDGAGNQAKSMRGEWMTGSDEDFLDVTVSPSDAKQ